MKRSFSIFLLVVLLYNISAFNISAADALRIEADFGENDSFNGISSVVMQSGGDIKDAVAVRGGKKGYEIPVDGKAMYIDFKDDFLSELDDGTEVHLDVEYYDQNDGHFIVIYDSLEGRSLPELVIVQNTNRWKTKSFVIDDAFFGGRLEGHDIKIALQDTELNTTPPSSVVIGKITVTKYPKKNPIRSVITSDEVGNIFSPADENIMKVDFHNFSGEEENADVTLDVVKENGDVVWSYTDVVSLEAKGDLHKEYKIDLNEFGLYNFRVTVQNDKIYSVTERAMSYVNTDKNGIRNEKLLAVTHWDWRDFLPDGQHVPVRGSPPGQHPASTAPGDGSRRGPYRRSEAHPTPSDSW